MLLIAGTAFANTINVPGDYPTIQAAIEISNSGDVVQVAPGDYYESIRLKPGVTVQGSGADVTTIRGDRSWWQFKWWTYAVLGADDSTISGFTITRSYLGIINFSSSPTITNNIIIDNNTGIFNDSGSFPTITNNIIIDNMAGISNFSSSPAITNNTITGNRYYGIYSYYSSSAITNNIITDNEFGIINSSGSYPTITYNDIWNNTIDIHNYGSSSPTVADNISVDPLFIDPKHDDYHLQTGSLCIDAGMNDAPGLPETDLEGNPRVLDGDGDEIAVVDMGAYEFVKGEEPSGEELIEKLEELIAAVEGLSASYGITLFAAVEESPGIPNGIAQSLIAKLEATLDKVITAFEDVEAGDIEHAENMANTAVNTLEAFINEVEAQRGKEISQEDADYLIDVALSVIEGIDSILG